MYRLCSPPVTSALHQTGKAVLQHRNHLAPASPFKTTTGPNLYVWSAAIPFRTSYNHQRIAVTVDISIGTDIKPLSA